MSGLDVNLDRFGGAEPRDAEYSSKCCAHCDDDIMIGAYVVRTYEDDYVHYECWHDYCDQFYAERFGYMGSDDID